jgi:hypothetical protein
VAYFSVRTHGVSHLQSQHVFRYKSTTIRTRNPSRTLGMHQPWFALVPRPIRGPATGLSRAQNARAGRSCRNGSRVVKRPQTALGFA